MAKTETSLTETPISKMLFMMAAPISLGMLSTFLFQVVDTFFVGRLGSDALAALAFSSSVYFLFVALFMGISVGVSSVVAKATGANDLRSAQTRTTLTMLFVLVAAVALSLVARQQINPIFTMLGACAGVLPLVHDYMSILFLGFPFLILGIVSSGAVRGAGVIARTEVIFGIAGIINVVFDYLLIFGAGPFPEMGIAGAAAASALSFVFIFAGNMSVMFSRQLLSLSAIAGMADNIKAARDVARIATPTVAMQVLLPTTGIFTTFILAKHGPEVVAAFGIASRVEALPLVGIFAVSMAMTPFIAQNYSASHSDRIDAAIVFGGRASIYIGLLFFVLLAIFGPAIGRLFSDDPAVVSFVGLFFRIVAVSYGFVGIMNVTSSIFNGLQMPGKSLKIVFVKTFVFTIPLLLIASLISATAVLVALAAGNILSGIYAGVVMRRDLHEKNRPIAKENPLDSYKADFRKLLRLGR
jgi:putative MATE family efflux protein